MKESGQASRGLGRGQRQMLMLVAAITVGGLLYRVIVRGRLEQTALLFVGVPAVLAMLLALAPPAKSLVGGIVKGISFALLLSGPLLGEGFICIVMAAPLFLLVGVLIGGLIEWSERRQSRRALRCCALLALAPMCLEGTSGRMSFRRGERVEASEMVAGSVTEVRERMSRSPRVDLELPAYLRMGFPRPAWARGEGLAAGDTRTIHFAGGEGTPCDLVMRVAAADVDSARFVVANDGCAGMHSVGHWLTLRGAEVRWEAADAGHTRVRWALLYERRLDPAWYFGPWERYGTWLAARYLIDANAGSR